MIKLLLSFDITTKLIPVWKEYEIYQKMDYIRRTILEYTQSTWYFIRWYPWLLHAKMLIKVDRCIRWLSQNTLTHDGYKRKRKSNHATIFTADLENMKQNDACYNMKHAKIMNDVKYYHI